MDLNILKQVAHSLPKVLVGHVMIGSVEIHIRCVCYGLKKKLPRVFQTSNRYSPPAHLLIFHLKSIDLNKNLYLHTLIYLLYLIEREIEGEDEKEKEKEKELFNKMVYQQTLILFVFQSLSVIVDAHRSRKYCQYQKGRRRNVLFIKNLKFVNQGSIIQ